jgi:hypothetical protein
MLLFSAIGGVMDGSEASPDLGGGAPRCSLELEECGATVA